MSDGESNPWKLTTIAMVLVIATALITGLVVASWNNGERPGAAAPPAATSAAVPAPPRAVTAPLAPPRPVAAAAPSPADVEACNAYAKNQTGDKTLEVVKDAVIGGAGGTFAGGGRGAGKGAGVGGVVETAAGTLYGLNEAGSHDARYVEAYRACMKGRGYTS